MIRENVYDNFDEFYRDLVNYIVSDKGTDIKENVRTVYADGTPAYYRQIVGLQVRFKPYKDDKGNYRALLPTTRYAPYKSAIKESLWIWLYRSNDEDFLRNNLDVSYWKNWTIKERKNNICYVEEKRKEKYKLLKEIKAPFEKKYNSNNKKYKSKFSGYFYVLERKDNKCLIQFENTNYIKEVSKGAIFENCGIKDNYVRNCYDLGYLGNIDRKDIIEYFGNNFNRWYEIWRHIIKRSVYNIKHYENIFCSEEFHSCEYFLEWVMKNNIYGRKYLNVLQIDKDYYNSNYYGEDSCVLLLPKENTSLTKKTYWFKYEKKYFFSERQIIKYIFNLKNDNDILNYRPKFRKLKNELLKNGKLIILDKNKKYDGKLLRFSLDVINTIGKGYGYQLAKPLYNYSSQVDYIIGEIKNNPNSRRIITELWNVDDLEDMTLTPCLHLTQWTVENSKLILSIRQRSCDTALGLVSNIWQYQVLQHLIAKECNLEVGDLIWTVDNLHIYDRHIDKLGEQIMRKFYNPPTFKINNFNGFYSFKWSDVELIDYKYGDKIKYEVAI